MNSVTALLNDTLSDRIDSELRDIRPGSPGALLHVRLQSASGKSISADSSLLERLEAEMPVKVSLDNRGLGGLVIWLPRTHRESAVTLARLIRTLVIQRPLQIEESATIDSGANACSIGLVTIAQNNWEADAIVATAEVTSAMAAIKKTNSICFADQVSRPS